jgi:O-antigen/teichoic acid export membrane protein
LDGKGIGLNLLKKLVATGFSRGLTAAGTLGLNVALARNLSTSEFGDISVCLVAVIAISIFSKFGFDTSLLRFGGAAWHAGQSESYRRYCKLALISTAAISVSVLAITVSTLSVVSIPWDAADLFCLMMYSVPFLTISGIIASCLKAAHRPELGALLEMGGASLFACAIVLLSVLMGYNITVEYAAQIFVLSTVLFCAVGFVSLYWISTNQGEPSPSTSSTIDEAFAEDDGPLVAGGSLRGDVTLLTYFLISLDFLVVSGAQVLGNWSGVFFLEYFESSTTTAVFSAARRTSLVPLLLLGIVVSIFSPKLAGVYQSGDQPALKRMVHRASLVVCLVNVPVLLLMCLGAPWWMSMFGTAYKSHWLTLAIMSAGQLVGAVTGIATGVMGMTGNQRKLRTISITSAIAATVLAALLSAQFGLLGAAAATAFYAAGQSLCIAWAVRRQLGYWPFPSLEIRPPKD